MFKLGNICVKKNDDFEINYVLFKLLTLTRVKIRTLPCMWQDNVFLSLEINFNIKISLQFSSV